MSEDTPHERLLFAVAYRMLGSVADAEDVLQETYLRWAAADRAAVADPRAWLVTVASRLALDRLRSAQHRRETYVGSWLPEPLLTDPTDPAEEAAMADSLSLAFLVVLETLTPAERAAFVLHDVFGYPHDEVARILARSPAAARQLASRARRRVAEGRPRYDADRRAGDAVADAFLAACAGGDLAALVRLLDPDVVMESDGGGIVAALRRPLHGAAAVSRFLGGLLQQADGYAFERATVNAEPGFVIRRDGAVNMVWALGVHDGRIARIYALRNPHKLAGAMRRRP